jgi:cytochrome P450
MTVVDRPTVILRDHDAIRQALFDPNLSRTFDPRSYDEGNIRDGVVSVSHGQVHRARRRVENTQFRADRLQLYERDLFPKVLEALLAELIDREAVDVFLVGEMVSVVLAARRAGLDIDDTSMATLSDLVGIVDVFSQGSAILDARDPDAIRALVRTTYDRFEATYVRPAWTRRATILAGVGTDLPSEPPHDILTVLLQHRADPALELSDDGRVVREVATYLQGGTHTSAQTLTNAIDLLFGQPDHGRSAIERLGHDVGFAQRVVHEALRLRPTTPKIKRRALAATTLGGTRIPAEALVILDAAAANRSPELYGPDPDGFDPDRRLAAGVARWGLAFGAGPHQCPGRTVAGGLPVGPDLETADGHLFGLVALMLQGVARRVPRPDEQRAPERDTRTERETRWAHYPVRFERWSDPIEPPAGHPPSQ